VIRSAGGHVSRVHARLRNPHGVAVSPDGGHAYVTDPDHDAVLVIDTARLASVARIPVGRTPWHVVFGAGGSTAYVTNANDNTVSAIDTARRGVIATVPLGAGTTTDAQTTFTQLNQIPTALGLSPDGKIWVTCNASSSVVVIDPAANAVVKSIDIGLGDEPTGIAFAASS
jgi:phospholipase C